MPKRIEDVGRVIEDLKLRISDYLESQGHKPNHSKQYKCPFPSHNGKDTHPSASVAPSGQVLHCFGCGGSANIFNLAHMLEGMDASGAGFYDTVKNLATRFSIPFTEVEGEESHSDVLRQTWSSVVNIIGNNMSEGGLKVTDARAWDRGVVGRMRLGTVKNNPTFVRKCAEVGVSEDMLHEIGMLDDEKCTIKLIHKDRIYFPIMNEHGDPIAMGIMNTAYKKDDPVNGWKYRNTMNSAVYTKGRTLYGFNVARTQGNGPLFIVEGYADLMSLYSAGVMNSVALCGTAFTEDHAQLLVRYRRHNIVLALDGDTAGRDRTLSAIAKYGYNHGVRISVMTLPDGEDPDDVIRRGGRDAFLALPVQTSIQWLLNHYRAIVETEHDVANEVCKIIFNEPDHIERDRLCSIVSRETGVPLRNIRDAVAEHRDVDAHKVRDEMKREKDKMISRIQKENRIEVVVDILRESTSRINRLQQMTETENKVSERDAIVSMIDNEDNKVPGYDGAETGIHWMDEALDGFPTDGDNGMIIIGGKPNSGKSSLMLNIARSLLMRNENNIIFYQTIDDTQRVLYNRWCACSTGLPINAVRNPNRYRSTPQLLANLGMTRTEFDQRRLDGYQELIELVDGGRLIVRDQTSIPSVGYARGVLESLREEHPDTVIYYFLDAFNNLAEVSGSDDQRRISTESACSELKNINHQLNIPTIYTSHYRKVDHLVRPNNEDLKESGILHYHPIVTMHVWNPLSEDPNHDGLVWEAPNSGSRRDLNDMVDTGVAIDNLPVLEVNVAKNKKSDFKGFCYLNFEPNCTRIHEPTPGEVQRYRESSRRIGTSDRRR